MMRLYGSKLLLLGAAAALLAGCGGSSGGGGEENKAPVANNDGPVTVGINKSITIDVLANDTDENGNETIVGSSLEVTGEPEQGSVAPENGMLVYTAGETVGTYTFRYTVKDDKGLVSNEATVTVEVSDNAPGFTSTPPLIATPGELYKYDITTTDPDNEDTLTIAAPTRPEWLILTDNGDGTATLEGTPDADGIFDVLLTVTDSTGQSVEQPFIIEVTTNVSKWDEAQWDNGTWAP